jgi:hypothetical protein
MRASQAALPVIFFAAALALGLSNCLDSRQRAEPLPRADAPTDLGQRALAHAVAVVAMGERRSGTPGWQQQLDYIATHLERAGLPVRRDRWHDEAAGLTFENIAATIRGSSAERVVIACHHDTKCCSGHADPAHNFPYVGANDGGSGVGLLLALAPALAARAHPVATIELVFFDGEESLDFKWNAERALFGSRRYVAQQHGSSAPIRSMVLLDLVGAADLQIDDDTNSDRRLVAIFARAAAAHGHGELFFKHRLAVSDDHLPFLAAGIPAIDLIDLHDNPQWHTADDTIEHLSAASLQKVGEVVLTAVPQIEREMLTAAPRPRGG